MKCIDMRCRPPYASFKNAFIYTALGAFASTDRSREYYTSEAVVNADMEAFVADMKKNDVVKGVVPVRATPVVDSSEISDTINDFYFDLLQEYPDMFIGMPGINPLINGIVNSLREIKRLVIDGPCTGVNLDPCFGTDAVYADDGRYYAIYEYCQDNDLPVLMTFGGGMNKGVEYHDPQAIDHIAKDFPKLRICLAHAAWPYATQACWVAFNRANVYLSPDDYFLNRFPGNNVYIEAINSDYLEDKILFGTAIPFLAFDCVIEHYLNCGVKEHALEKLMYANAAAFLGI